MRFLGIDPGLHRTGYACVERRGPAAAPALLEAGLVRIAARRPLSERLRDLDADLAELAGELRPDVVAVEQVFSHPHHVRAALLLAHARGVALVAATRCGAALVELAPAEVKRAISGRGRASKELMQRAVAAQCGLAEPPDPPDVADAIAIALCAARRDEGHLLVDEARARPLSGDRS